MQTQETAAVKPLYFIQQIVYLFIACRNYFFFFFFFFLFFKKQPFCSIDWGKGNSGGLWQRRASLSCSNAWLGNDPMGRWEMGRHPEPQILQKMLHLPHVFSLIWITLKMSIAQGRKVQLREHFSGAIQIPMWMEDLPAHSMCFHLS